MQGMAWVFFALFALALVGMYLGIRRSWAAPGVIAAAGVAASIILMTLTALAQNNLLIQAIIVGVLVGGLFSGATLAVAWYFHSSELRARYAADAADRHPVQDPAD